MKKMFIFPIFKNISSFFFNNFAKLFILTLFSMANNSRVIAQWAECNNGIIDKNAVSCFIIDGNNTYAGMVGGIFKTTNNGNNWIEKNNGLYSVLNEIFIGSLAIHGNNIFAGTDIDGIFLSTDKGENWVRKSNGLPTPVEADTIYSTYISSLKIVGNYIFAGTAIGIYLSTDNGDNWTAKNNGLTQIDSFNIVFSITNIGNYIFAGTRHGVYMTPDKGDNWFPKSNGIGNTEILTLEVYGNNIYAAPVNGGIYLSTDTGENWNIVGLKETTIVEPIIIRDNYIIVGGGAVYISTDNGNSWTSKGLEDYSVDAMIINGDYIFAGIDNHGIFRAKLSDLGITDVKEQEQRREIKIIPNPASDEFRLKFHAPYETEVQINIFDLLGNKVWSRVEQATEGTNEKNINCEKLPQGYYYVKINVNEVVETIPMVIVK